MGTDAENDRSSSSGEESPSSSATAPSLKSTRPTALMLPPYGIPRPILTVFSSPSGSSCLVCSLFGCRIRSWHDNLPNTLLLFPSKKKKKSKRNELATDAISSFFRRLHSPRLCSHRRGRRLRRLVLPLPRFSLRHLGPYPEGPCADQPRGSRIQLHRRRQACHRLNVDQFQSLLYEYLIRWMDGMGKGGEQKEQAMVSGR